MDNVILTAATFAREAHGTQKRKYNTLPYIYHPARVAGRAMILECATPELVAAAFMHDVLEDTAVTQQEMVDVFGEKITSYVEMLTNEFTKTKYPALSRKERKAKEADRLSQIPTPIKFIKALDRIDNLLEIDMADKFTTTYLKESGDLCIALTAGLDRKYSADFHVIHELGNLVAQMKEKHG